MWHVSSRSGVATLRTAIHLLLTYLLTYTHARARAYYLIPIIHTSRFHPLPHTHTHTFNGPFSGTTQVSRYQKGKKTIRMLLKQETVSGSGISWAVCKSAPRSREITMLAPHHSVFYRPDALPAAQPTASKHWRSLPTEVKTETNYLPL